MTTNFHTPIAVGAPANSGIINAPLGQLDAELTAQAADITSVDTRITDVLNGDEGFLQLNLGADSSLTISGGIIAVTRTMHLVDTEGAAALDLLDTINGGADGDFLVLSSVSSARVVRLKHNTGNIWLAHQGDINLTDVRQKVILIYDATNSRWVQNFSFINVTTPRLAASNSPAAQIIVPDEALRQTGPNTGQNIAFLDIMARPHRRLHRVIQAAAATIDQWGMAAPTTAGTLTNSNQSDTTYTNFASVATTGNFAGIISTTFNLARRQYNPHFSALVRTGGVITVMRFWIGLTSAAVGNTDDPGAAGTSFIGFRYSTVAADGAWLAATADGGSTTTLTTGVGITTSTSYLFQFRVDSGLGIVYFSVNDSTEVQLSATLPAVGTDLGIQVRAETRENVAKSLAISRVYLEHN